jgi:hypothetical protein
MSTGPTPPSPPAGVQYYPGGEDAPAYRWSFTLWLVLFLGVVCLGLLNFLGIAAKRMWPNM